jgi:hypothetical protein
MWVTRRASAVVASVLGAAGRIDVMVNNTAVQVEARLGPDGR